MEAGIPMIRIRPMRALVVICCVVVTALACLSPTMTAASAGAAPGSQGVNVQPLSSATPKPSQVPPTESGTGFGASGNKKAKQPVPVADLLGRHSATSVVSQNPDGTLRVQQASVPINYPTTNGWQPIDNTIGPITGQAGRVGTSGNS
jgi:hypothetical protein